VDLRVLVVDDEPSIRENLHAYLEDEGMRVETTLSCEEAMRCSQQGQYFDVCVMNIRLRGMDGNTGILALHARCPSLRFLVHTGTADYSLPDALRVIGITDAQVFKKPLTDMAPLARAIRDLSSAAKTDSDG
jgi:DNA-binding NtrC family response regulator